MKKRTTQRITKRLIDSMEPPEGGRVNVFDSSLSGFGVSVFASGTRSFFVMYGPANRRRRMTLGKYGPLTVDRARAMAQAKLGEIVNGEDPLDTREERRKVPTFGQWADEYLKGVRLRKKQPRHDERYLGQAKDLWGTRPVDAITQRQVRAAMERIASQAATRAAKRSDGESTATGHTTANRWLASVRACFQQAKREGLIPENPAWEIRQLREAPPRARVLTDEEYAKVVEVIDAIPDPFLRSAFLLLMDTGARKSEVLRASWADMDLGAGLWRIPSPKAGHPQVVPLAKSTVQLLEALERMGPWVVPGRDPAKHRADLKRPWEAIRGKAGLGDVTIHDLRRTFGVHVAKRAGLHVASKLLRHSDIRVTERVYVPLGVEALREALEGTHEDRGKVIDLERARRRAEG